MPRLAVSIPSRASTCVSQHVCGEPTVQWRSRFRRAQQRGGDVDHQRWQLMEEENFPGAARLSRAHGGLDSCADLSGHTLAHCRLGSGPRRLLADFNKPPLPGAAPDLFRLFPGDPGRRHGRGVALAVHVWRNELQEGIWCRRHLGSCAPAILLAGGDRAGVRKPAALVRDWLPRRCAGTPPDRRGGATRSLPPPRARSSRPLSRRDDPITKVLGC